MCCTDGVCSMVLPWECTGDIYESCLNCDSDGCPAFCCEELPSGDTSCTAEYEKRCAAPRVTAASCDAACAGACCIDGVNQGQMTRVECDTLGGAWGGLGSTACPNLCRAPFDATCCETATSGGFGLTFTQPLLKRSPPFSGTVKAVVTGKTDSPILIHGTPAGSDATKRCGFSVEVLLCGDSFNIEPIPCGSRFRNLEVTVCWLAEAVAEETLNFSGCNSITVWLGRCERNCFTTLSYAGPGHTSNADIILSGDAFIEASGAGALVLTSDITQQGSACNNLLTLRGTSIARNTISGVINDRPGGNSTQVDKTGAGWWVLSGLNEFSGGFALRQGTLVVGADVGAVTNSPSPLGTAANPTVGDAGYPGQVAFLLADNVTMSRDFTVAAGAILGGEGSCWYSSTQITLTSNVTLQAADTATVTFNNQWTSAAVRTVTFGTLDHDGTVVMNQGLGFDWPVVVDYGTAKMGASDVITSSPVTINSATLDVAATSQTLPSITFGRSDGALVGASVTLGYSGNAALSATGPGHQIDAAVSLAINATVTINTGADLTITGVLSGTGGVTKEGNGLLLLSGANTQTGATVINAGTVRAGNVSAFGTGGITVNAGGTLDKNGYALTNTITNNGGTVLN